MRGVVRKVQGFQGDRQERLHKHSRQVEGGFVVGVAVAAAGASFTFMSQDVSDLVGVALGVMAIIAVAGGWMAVGSVFAARLIALGQGMVWFFLLIHGGLGFVFGPMGWTASALGDRAPRLAVALLAVPAAYLAMSWLPLVFDADGLGLHDGLTLLALILPAVVAAGFLMRAHTQQRMEPGCASGRRY